MGRGSLRWGMLFKIAKKDWGDIKSNKQILLPMTVVPVMFAVFMPVVLIVLPLYTTDPSEFAELGGAVGFLMFYANAMLRPFFVMIPLMITMAIASDSWAGEKERKTAESLFLLPLNDTELFVAKVMASFVPGMVITWACAAAMMVIVDIAALPFLGYVLMPDAGWLFQLFVFSPIIAFFSIFVNVYVSYRARDTKSAQQIGGSVLVIFFGVFIGGFFGQIDVITWIMAAILGGLDVVFVVIAPRIFSRENMIAKF